MLLHTVIGPVVFTLTLPSELAEPYTNHSWHRLASAVYF